MDWKTQREKILDERIETNARANKDMGFRKEVLFKCLEDSVYWCNNFAWTFDPRQEFFANRNLPFILFPEQVEYVRWIEILLRNNDDGLIEKSRDMGISYATLIPIVLYRFLFHEFNAKLGSRIESYVDKPGDPDSLFWKIKYNLRRQPKWMLPEEFSHETHITYMKVSRPDNSNTITGESANENFARAGRNNLTVFDELAFWPWSKASWESSGESTTTRLAISTPPPIGRDSFFYKLGMSGRVRKFTFHYKDDPRKDKKWEEKQKKKKTEEEFERELNISYEGSLENTVYARDFNRCEFGKFEYIPALPLYIAWDFGLDGVAIQWYQWDSNYDKWYLIDSYFNSDKDIGFYVPFITGDIEMGYNYEDNDLMKIQEHRKWKKNAIHYGDPDVAKRSLLSKLSTKQFLQQKGIYLQSQPWGNKTHYDMKQKTVQFFKKLSIDEDNNEFFCESIRLSRYPERQETSQNVTPITKPIHNIYSHHRSALEYMADNVPIRVKSKPIEKYYERRSIYER